ncbi:hypothetical protein [Aeromonas phage AS-zj]|uniref:CapR homology domain-containing protein n=2 Tax=Ceceduovirus aszj TaxID=2843652 RepID=A0A291LDS8_9CAUD|nr:endonuclease [Aeromonas phage AS-zj]ASU00506.1 hypothetical protein [Aeromonas phage AS-zj]ATI17491.1 hypothetical protein [Aeromonas phage AS-szw]
MKDEFIGSTFKTPKGGVLTVGEVVDVSKSRNKIYSVNCSLCSPDIEMYPLGFRSTKGNLNSGQIPCGCSPTSRKTPEQAKLLVYRIFEKEEKYKFVEYVGEYKNASSKFRYECLEHGIQTTSYNNFVNNSRRCNDCGHVNLGIKRRESNPEQVVDEICSEREYKFVGFEGGTYLNQNTYVLYECHIHGIQKTSFSHFKHGVGCPSCSGYGYDKSKSGWFYIFEYTKDNDTVYKYGITNRDPDIRSKEHIKGIHNVVSNCVLVKQFEDGNLPLIIESKIKAKYNGVCDWLFSGNTETVTKDNLNDILSIVEDLT